MFSKACEHGIRAMIFLAQKKEHSSRTSLKEIAGAIGSPQPFTAKILQSLARHGYLESSKGPTGGFALARPAGDINLAEIVGAIDGEKLFNGCALGLPRCDNMQPCPLHHQFVAVRDHLHLTLIEADLQALAKGLLNGNSYLTRN